MLEIKKESILTRKEFIASHNIELEECDGILVRKVNNG